MSIERRREARTSLILKVQVAGRETSSCTGDLSARGAFIFQDDPPPVGARVVVEASFPGLVPARALAGVVRWVRDGDPFVYGRPRGFGVEWDAPLQGDPLAAAVQQKPVRLQSFLLTVHRLLRAKGAAEGTP
jgi:hypothetical protein